VVPTRGTSLAGSTAKVSGTQARSRRGLRRVDCSVAAGDVLLRNVVWIVPARFGRGGEPLASCATKMVEQAAGIRGGGS